MNPFTRHHAQLHDLAERDGWACVWCSRVTVCRHCQPVTDPALIATREHMIPSVHGGSDELDNLAVSCFQCNMARGPRVAAPPSLAEQATRATRPKNSKPPERPRRWLREVRRRNKENWKGWD